MYGDNTHTPDSNISDVTRKAFRVLEQKYPWRKTKHREKIFYVLVHIFECCIGICNAKSIKLLQKIFPHLDAFYRTMIHNSKSLLTITKNDFSELKWMQEYIYVTLPQRISKS